MSCRLWDAVGGFLFLFAHMQEKLSKNSTQVDLLQELLNLQKDLITMLLSMLEGNVVNGTIGKQVTTFCIQFSISPPDKGRKRIAKVIKY